MLKYTLILPDADEQLAAKLLRAAIDDLNVVLMLVFGQGEKAEQVIAWADQLCAKFENVEGQSFRRVVWNRHPEMPAVRNILDPILSGAMPFVAVLNFFNRLKAILNFDEEIDPIALEIAFMKGHQV